MSTCDNCDCTDKSQCVKKRNNYTIDIIETEKSYLDEVVHGGVVAAEAEHGGQCKCGTACACVDCQCGK
ncbi:hypothetical protein ZIOFF_019219 [Zingiber officinale]|uniref:Uncharacterized protein n=1 Tax=Zingiber officinale TaxID=94328 RepID=A0A8J5HDY6_ZINOF|nr:hypothetical protein ZIOFF_022653 [Zingiber officinale]KAG6522085.1 hypothetical protein ZIOFF_019219 [Zingiber officinale]